MAFHYTWPRKNILLHITICYCYKYIILFLFCCVLGIFVGKYSVSLEQKRSYEHRLQTMGITYEETEDELRYVCYTPETVSEVTEMLTVSKVDGKTAYYLNSKRMDEPDYFYYNIEDGADSCKVQYLMFGTYEKALIMNWTVQSVLKCTDRMFSLPSTKPGMEVYHDMDGNGMCDWRFVRNGGEKFPELLVDQMWVPVEGMYEKNSLQSCVLINGESTFVSFQDGKWIVADETTKYEYGDK